VVKYMGVLMGSSTPHIRFERFEVNARSGELFRQGAKVKLQNQLFQVLLALLERPGEVVTREELKRKLWPENTFVDFDQGLNKAINGLRAALRDRAKKPRFIETLPQRGYRFIAPLEKTAIDSGGVMRTPDGVRPAHAPRIDSLVVLPLENISGDPAEEYFSDGMTEELICAVARIGSLRVISRTSAMMYKGARKPLPEIAKELRVDAVVEGTVARAGEKVRITAQLIYAPEDRHLWSGRYERDMRDILLLQGEIAQGIAGEIHKLLDPEHASPARSRRVHPQAYEARLKGAFFRDKMTPRDLEKSIGFFTQAIDLDSADAQTYGELSQAYFYMGLFGVAQPGEMFSKAKAHALTALRLDETIAAAHNALAVIHVLGDWDWDRAEAESRRAVELSPGHSVTHAQLADYLSIRARHDEAIQEFSRVLELDPISRMYLGHFGLILYRARRYDESIAQCRKALDVDPNYANALWFMALSLEQKGELSESVAKLEQAVNKRQRK
jgi:TolB-like protein